jgi:carbamoyl-phosphate synthase large subunit
MTIKILVSGAGGDVAQGVLKSLQASNLKPELFATCVTPYSSWLHKDGVKGFVAPLATSADYVPFLIKLINKHHIDVFFPTVDSEILKIATEKIRIETETSAIVFVGDVDSVDVTVDKLKTAKFLQKFGYPYPVSVSATDPQALELEEQFGYPLIIKKRSGRGSQDVFKVNSRDELTSFLGNDEFLIQEWLDPSEGEYTSGIYLGDDGYVKGICTFKRELKHGSTYIAERVIDPRLEAPLEGMARKLGLKYVNIQAMRRDDLLVPFEFNGRLSGSTAMVSRVFNAPEMFINERILGEKLQRVVNECQFVAMRYYEEVYANPAAIEDVISRSHAI